MLPSLRAEDQLARIEAVTVPHLKDADRRSVLRDYVRTASDGQSAKAAPVTEGDLAAMGIGVKRVPKKKGQ